MVSAAKAGGSKPPTKTTGKAGKASAAGTQDDVVAKPARRRTAQGRFAPATVRIGVLSDTHGYLDPDVLTIFAGVDHIIHAGDVMDPGVLTALAGVAPVTAVCGNLDSGELEQLPREVTGDIAGVSFVVAHKPRRLLKRLAAGKYSVDGRAPDLVIWGHLHTPTVIWVDGSLHLNPGTATSPDDEDDGPTVAIVETTAHGLAVRFVPLPHRTLDDLAELVTKRQRP
jgi:uncharacterized protein